jgi:hypothetical protein
MTGIILINTILSAAALGWLGFVMSRPRRLEAERLQASRPATERSEAGSLRRAA